MTRALKAGFVVQGFMLMVLLTTALDVYAHKRVEQFGGVNIWGYRGATARAKRSNEIRLGLVGGTMAFGWGVAADETMLSSVRRLVSLEFDRPGRSATHVTAFNLGLPGLAHADYAERIDKYAGLNFDVLCVYPDPVDLRIQRSLVPPASGVEAITGYTPILPVVLDDKGVPMLGDLWRGIDRLMYGVVASAIAPAPEPTDTMIEAVGRALTHSQAVVIVLPVTRDGESDGIPGLRDRITARFGAASRLRLVDPSVDDRLRDPSLRLDGESFGAGGNALIGEATAPVVIALLRASPGR